jgi:hypothetical protein
MSETVDPTTGEIFDRTTITATGTLANFLDSTKFREELRDLDARIAAADVNIDNLKEDLKSARKFRELLVDELRAIARGERALPLTKDGT